MWSFIKHLFTTKHTRSPLDRFCLNSIDDLNAVTEIYKYEHKGTIYGNLSWKTVKPYNVNFVLGQKEQDRINNWLRYGKHEDLYFTLKSENKKKNKSMFGTTNVIIACRVSSSWTQGSVLYMTIQGIDGLDSGGITFIFPFYKCKYKFIKKLRYKLGIPLLGRCERELRKRFYEFMNE